MRPARRLAILGLLLGFAAVPLAPAEGFRPVPQFSPGEAVRYRMNLTFTIESSLGPEDDPAASRQSLSRAVDLTWRVEFVSQEPDGSLRLRAVIEALALEPPEWAERAQPSDFLGQAVTYRLSPDGRVDEIQLPASWSENDNAPPWLGAWLDLNPGSQPGLPAPPLKPGDRWKSTRARAIPGLPRQRESSESEYLRNELRGEVPCAAILTRYTVAGSDTREETGPDRTRTRTERHLEGEGDRLACHDLQTGRVLESTLHSRELLRLRVHDVSRDRRSRPEASGFETSRPLVLETRTQLESYLRLVD